jgi:hypothetical protein
VRSFLGLSGDGTGEGGDGDHGEKDRQRERERWASFICSEKREERGLAQPLLPKPTL